jgi:glucose-1-phosphate adenylyltransferase
MSRILGVILAGGKGTRLEPLTETRAKPAVPFGGKYRIIDFALSNFINSKIFSVYVLTQFKAQSLIDHIQGTWTFGSGILPDHFITVVPAQMRLGDSWYQGTADAVFQNLIFIQEHRPDIVCIFGGDHIYKMDISQMTDYHEEKKADVTIAATAVPISEAHQFGVLVIDSDWKIIGFEEKPKKPTPIPGSPDKALVSMGNYAISANVLYKELERDAADKTSEHDFGKSIFPRLYKDHAIYAYDFSSNKIPGQAVVNNYWKDVGTLDAYWEASMDLRSVIPELDLHNPLWPIRSEPTSLPSAKFVHNEKDRVGKAINSIVSEGSIISGGTVINSVIGCRVRVNSWAIVEDSVIMDDVQIGRNARIRRAIIDKRNIIGEGETVGYDLDADRKKGYKVTENGLVILPKRPKFTSEN